VVEEDLRIELDPARRRRESRAACRSRRFGMLGVAGLQWHAHAAGRGAQLL
jgi:hypothetical protein